MLNLKVQRMLNLIQKLFEPKTNCSEAAKLFADLLHVKITATTLKQDIEEHPNYPSLLCISDVLNNSRIANISASFDKDHFFKIPPPFITSITGEKRAIQFFSVVSGINNGNVHFYDHENATWARSAVDDFYKRSNGVVLMAEAEANAGEKNYTQKARAETRKQLSLVGIATCIPLLVVFSGIIGLIQNGLGSLLPITFALLTLAGAVVALLLIFYELDQYTPVLQKICRPTQKINCGAILNSKAATIGGISWSTIGFTYFTTQLLLLLFFGITNPQFLFVVSWFNAMAAPYILFSVFYQWRIARQWCVLCLTVQLILFLQLVIALMAQWHTAIPVTGVLTGSAFVSIASAILVPFISVILLVPAYRAAKRSKSNKLQLQRLKHNPQIFQSLLTKQNTLVKPVEGLGIVLGNRNASTRIVKVCNPYCNPCSESHTTLDELLDNNPDLQLQIIFSISNDVNDKNKLIARHLMAIAEKGEETVTRKALDNWYLKNTRKDYDSFAKDYPLNGAMEKQVSKVEAMQDWCFETKINATPTFFINGYQLPDMYSVTDLKYFLSV